MHHPDNLHQITLHTNFKKPYLEGELRTLAEYGLRNLPTRFPGLKVAHYTIHPDRVEMTLDFHRLDEDVLRVVQSYKSEVKNLAKRKGFPEDHLWQWSYEERWLGGE